MKQLLLTLMALALAGTAMADSYLYLDDFEVIPGQRITVPVKANFDGRVSGFQLDLTYPQGLTPVSIREGGDMAITYLESDGSEQTQSPAFYPNQAHDCCIAIFTNAGFWDPDGDGMYEQYGVIKWEAGAYDEMMLLTLNVDEGFTGDEIMLETELSSGSDTRGGTVTDLGQAGQLYSYVCHVTVKPEVTALPVINVQEGDEAYTIMAVGDGVVTLYINGEVVENPYMVYRTE